MNIYRISTIAAIITLAIILRFLPHPYNFTPVVAVALFGGAYFGNKLIAFLTPMIVMFVSDLMLQLLNGHGFHSSMWLVYGSFALVTLLGILMQNRVTPVKVLGFSITGTTIFFLITNFAFFYKESAVSNPSLGTYPHNFSGIIASYIAGLPFLQNALVGDIFYSTILFGVFYLLEKRFSVLKMA